MLSSNLCVICDDTISDPVCRSCYVRQTEILLNDLNLNELSKKIILKKIKNKFPLETLNKINCILCAKENVSICRYCFSIILTSTLRSANFTEDSIENFGFYPENEEIKMIQTESI